MIPRLVHGVYALRRRVASEERFVRRALATYLPAGGELLDVGCGHGRFFEIARGLGLRYRGVDVNEATVAKNRALGRDVVAADAFLPEEGRYDGLLLAHLIEHFEPEALVALLNGYLPSLRIGGVVIVLTPLENRGFYDDFDHVKPYNPEALRQLFCHSSDQTKGFGLRGHYVEEALWFKRDPLGHTHRRGLWHHGVGLPLTLAYVASAGLVGRLNGYGMVLRKTA